MLDSQSSKKKIQIVIASDFTLIRKGIKSLLEEEAIISVTGEASNLNEIFNAIRIKVPDIIIINLELQAELLNSLCLNINTNYPKLPILLFLNETINISITNLIINGVRGILWKENTSDEMIEAIHCLANGGSFFEDPKNCKFNCHLSHKLCEHDDTNILIDLLTSREKDVLKLIGWGLSYKGIAKELEISIRTVESHKNNAMAKLHLSNKYELIRFALENFHTE